MQILKDAKAKDEDVAQAEYFPRVHGALGMAAQACNSSLWEMKAGEPEI